MPIVSVYQCPRCHKKWNMDKKSKYIEHLRHHVSRDRFKSLWKEVENENNIMLAKLAIVKGYNDFVKIIQDASPLIFYNDLFFSTEEISDINLVRNIERYVGKKIHDIFPEAASWTFFKEKANYRHDIINYNISFGKGELFMASEFSSRRFDSNFSMNIHVDKNGPQHLSVNVSESSYFSNEASKTLFSALETMRKLKE